MGNMMRNRCNLQLLMFFLLLAVGPVLCADNIVKVGLTHTFDPKVIGTPEIILWKFNNEKVVEYEDEKMSWYQFRNQGALDIKTGVFTLKDLTKENSGNYEAEILVSGMLLSTKFTLTVKDGVGEPTISCLVADDGQKTLTCSVAASVEPVEYNWSGPGGIVKTGKMLNVSKETNHESVYFCTASNDVDKQSNQFTLQACYGPGPVLCADNIVKVGLTHTFDPKVTGIPEIILWKFNNEKVVEYEDEKISWYQFCNQGALDIKTGVFTLKNLTKENSGDYEAEILVSGRLQATKFTLTVKDGVGEPTISCLVADDGQKH